MDERGRRQTLGCRRWGRVVVLLAAWAGVQRLPGAEGRPLHPAALQRGGPRHQRPAAPDEHRAAPIRRLAGLHRPAEHHQPVRARGGGSYPGPEPGGQTNFGVGGLSGRDTPTLSYHPREGREIAKALLTPLSADLFSVVNAGANIEQLLLLTVNDINDVPNAPRATTLTPRVPDDNTRVPPRHPAAGRPP